MVKNCKPVLLFAENSDILLSDKRCMTCSVLLWREWLIFVQLFNCLARSYIWCNAINLITINQIFFSNFLLRYIPDPISGQIQLIRVPIDINMVYPGHVHRDVYFWYILLCLCRVALCMKELCVKFYRKCPVLPVIKVSWSHHYCYGSSSKQLSNSPCHCYAWNSKDSKAVSWSPRHCYVWSSKELFWSCHHCCVCEALIKKWLSVLISLPLLCMKL